MPSSPGRLVEDIAEIMKKEQNEDTAIDSMYETDTSCANSTAAIAATATVAVSKRLSASGPTGVVAPKKAKKSLESSWETADLPYVIETPVCCRSLSEAS